MVRFATPLQPRQPHRGLKIGSHAVRSVLSDRLSKCNPSLGWVESRVVRRQDEDKLELTVPAPAIGSSLALHCLYWVRGREKWRGGWLATSHRSAGPLYERGNSGPVDGSGKTAFFKGNAAKWWRLVDEGFFGWARPAKPIFPPRDGEHLSGH